MLMSFLDRRIRIIAMSMEELWFVEVFPQKRETIPKTPGERKDRKDELWQNSLVQQRRLTLLLGGDFV